MVSGRGKSVRTSVLLPESQYFQLQALAAANDVSTSWIVRQAVIRFLSENEGQTELPLRMGKG
ncbi:ribbon-helix-helix domain-containing protein [Sphingobium chlorophenolicum]|uniref:Ribbon-helix-helix protein CopG domain-containing protein n=1 Tax=Sphingobium chlorophenolicum TaxID=46429 RepID=A0A081RDK0_SPHCR|nr:ribbon-helix-helix domain-containing protein [Sphingobium chlorophenolicum]KEQ53273.1 hypothetical protein BV95_02425 [Sphingobium chlorophenolicum]